MSDRSVSSPLVAHQVANLLLAAVMESSPLAVLSLDTDGCVTSWNPAAERLFTWREEEVLGSPLPIVPDELQAEFKELLRRRLASETFGIIETRRRRKDGSLVDVQLSTAPLKDAGDQIVGTVSIFKDITDRKRAEQALRVSQATFAGIVSIAIDAIISVDEAQRIKVFNRGAERIFGYTEEEIMGQHLEVLLPERFRDVHRRHIVDFGGSCVTARHMGDRTEIFGRRKNGEEFPAEASISKLDIDGRTVFTVMLREITERKRNEEAIRFSESKLSGIVSLATDAIISIDDQQRVTVFNRGAEHIFGYLEEEVVGRTLDMLLPERFGALHREHIRAFGQSTDTSRTMGERREIFGRRKNGEEFPAEASILKLDVSGKRIYAIVLRDISERKRVEMTLRRQATLIDLAPAAIIVRDLNDRITLFSRGAEAHYGWTSAEALGANVHELLRTRFPGDLEDIRRTLMRTGSWQGELTHSRRTGEDVVVESRWALQRDDRGAPVALLEIAVDVTARKEAETIEHMMADVGLLLVSTLEPKARLSDLVNLLVPLLADCCIIHLVDDHGRSEAVQVAAIDSEKEILVRELLKALPYDSERTGNLFARVLRSGEALLIPANPAETIKAGIVDEQVRQLIDRLCLGSLMVIPLLARGRGIGAMALATFEGRHRLDSNDFTSAQEIVRRAALSIDNAHLYQTAQRALVARDDMLRVVYHDLGNPIDAIGTVANVLQRMLPDGDTGKQLREPLKMIETTAKEMETLLNDLLDAVRMEAGHLTLRLEKQLPGPVMASVVDVNRPLAAEKQIAIDLRSDQQLPHVLIDRVRLRQVFQNLIGNAIKFTPKGGRITIDIGQNDGAVTFCVKDSGPGIPVDHLARIFDRFWQAEREHKAGAGLGLAIAKGVVETHGGRIWAESTPGSGAAFYVHIPKA